MGRTSPYYIIGEIYGKMSSLLPHDHTLLDNTGKARNEPQWAIAMCLMKAHTAKAITPAIDKWVAYQLEKIECEDLENKPNGFDLDFDMGFIFGSKLHFTPDNLGEILNNRKITQVELSEVLDVNKSTVARWISGETKISNGKMMDVEIAIDKIMTNRWLSAKENKATDSD